MFQQRVKTYLCTSEKAGFLATRNDSLCEAFTFLMENIYVQLEDIVYQQIGIPMGTNCAPLIADLFLCCEEFV